MVEPSPCCKPLLCGDPAIEACVCTVDASCCQGQWTSACVALVSELGCGSCPPPEGPCCEVGVGPGCTEDPVESCVCAQLPDCCAGVWGPECVAAVDTLACGTCQEPPKGECCEAHAGGGCLDGAVESCVCEQLPGCCDGAWGPECVTAVDSLGCGFCEGPPKGECCEANPTPGCLDPGVEACVCGLQGTCCIDAWGPECVAAVDSFGCGFCEGPPKGECCEANPTPGCVDPLVEACVCNMAPDCCFGPWSDACVAMVDQAGCGACQVEQGLCCEAHAGAGCDEPAVEACVCAQAPACCEQQWDASCVELVDSVGCGLCEAQPGECCVAGEGPGCVDAEVQACVCEVDASCCDTQWTEACVALVESQACGTCGAPQDLCCEPLDTPSCEDPAISACVCAQDPFCCNVEWDELCVSEVETLGCGMCVEPPVDTGCCAPHDSPSCDDAAVSACVCAQDGFCCNVEWDGQCVAEVESFGCGMCG
ncbi:hypothetical protein [Nannocystis bainbridge]|uniref:Uncharacterized protein n=1 Tax=Nannocystis bainbridge TaxID=2995303 RepID=A0ABT5EDJ6_9BACT|nr:hypothetical protein [Nannocystis bainbridge]MDC0723630.1 hypothetical protein [Nannocystis bainbridge]